MKLYFKTGACSLASRITFNELGLPFSSEAVDTDKGLTQSGADFKTINPNGYVPVLEVSQGIYLSENPAILQYIADQKPDSTLAPVNGTLERARLQEALNFTGSELHKAFSPFFRIPDMSDEVRSEHIKNLYKKVQHIENQLSDGRTFLLGEDFTIADAYTIVVLNWANFINVDLSQYAKIGAYLKNGFARPAVIKSLKEEGIYQEETA
ncbi:glutathione binding-like protein [Hirschia baltica]|uniref:Glutathione S-transferase domain protein n=1 Tax=Hirschia baltica (strain ATCC 49814 / DSM 5838 / IFAM 1418) TaxID=582402 RepID=C6XRA2_HIRBI|nr:glutathione binding-like protein [Hirschia baltica]ACT58734.1 Glutathione S-transferase domain protein [Hirschia baltica ATCC 49814]